MPMIKKYRQPLHGWISNNGILKTVLPGKTMNVLPGIFFQFDQTLPEEYQDDQHDAKMIQDDVGCSRNMHFG